MGYNTLKEADSIYDYSELRREILSRYPTYKALCVAAGISTRSFSDKIGDISPWTSSEIMRIITALGLGTADIARLFFTKKQ